MSKIAHAHKLVASVAQEAANELYDTTMSDNLLFDLWKKQNPGANAKLLRKRFVAKNWGKCIPFARATLETMLTKPIDDATKEVIMEALVLDNTLLAGRASPMTVAGVIQGN